MAYRSFERFWQARHPPRYAAFNPPSSPNSRHSSQIQAFDAEITQRAKADPVARRLMTIRGIGPMAAEPRSRPSSPPPEGFHELGRDFAAWLRGLTPLREIDRRQAEARRDLGDWAAEHAGLCSSAQCTDKLVGGGAGWRWRCALILMPGSRPCRSSSTTTAATPYTSRSGTTDNYVRFCASWGDGGGARRRALETERDFHALSHYFHWLIYISSSRDKPHSMGGVIPNGLSHYGPALELLICDWPATIYNH